MSDSLKAMIEEAMHQEQLSHDFYQRLADLVEQPETKEMCRFLAREELEHKAFLGRCLTPEGCSLMGNPQDVHLAEVMKTPAITPDLSPKEALIVAMKREEGSYNFYQRLASLQPPGEARAFLEKMAKMELGHKEKMEYLFDNMAFPEAW